MENCLLRINCFSSLFYVMNFSLFASFNMIEIRTTTTSVTKDKFFSDREYFVWLNVYQRFCHKTRIKFIGFSASQTHCQRFYYLFLISSFSTANNCGKISTIKQKWKNMTFLSCEPQLLNLKKGKSLNLIYLCSLQ